jgi:hypothetical protein
MRLPSFGCRRPFHVSSKFGWEGDESVLLPHYQQRDERRGQRGSGRELRRVE